MKPGFFAPKGTLDRKPAHGQPCNRCGLCCMAVVCPVGAAVLKREQGPCPALDKLPDGTFACGLVAHPHLYAGARRLMLEGPRALSEAAAILVGSGTGCDARFNGEPADQSFYIKLEEWDRVNAGAVARAKRTWGIA